MTREFLRQGRVGLASMRERVELANGTFVIRSTPGWHLDRRHAAGRRARRHPSRSPSPRSTPTLATLGTAEALGLGVGVGGETDGDGSGLGDGSGPGRATAPAPGSATARGDRRLDRRVTVWPEKDGCRNGSGSLPSIADIMKSCQIAAGIVPPKTWDTPSTFSSGIWPSG